MRTGPFSDPAFVTLVNRYFVPLHLDNLDGSARRYGMEPGHENAYILYETPEVPGGPKPETVILGRLSTALDPVVAKRELLAFLVKHPEYHQPWPELAKLENSREPADRVKRAALLLDEGRAEEALEILRAAGAASPSASLLTARALHATGRLDEAAAALQGVPPGPAVLLERIRLALARGETDRASEQLDRFLASHADTPEAAEAYYLRGWLYHLAGADEDAIEIWQEGLSRHPPSEALYSQKALLTMIRQNWELPPDVDQEK